jgi:ELWxxDGT repeat protein
MTGIFDCKRCRCSALYRIDGQNAQKVSLFPDADTPRYLLGTFHQAGSTRLVLTASDNGLYISDGTPAGSVKLAGLRSLGDPTMTAINGMFLFSADDGSMDRIMESDGTPEGTRILKDIKPGLDSGYPMVFGHCGDRVCFFADDGVHGIEPWSSDGTSEGTQMLIDANNIPASSNPGHLVASDGKVYFTATNDGTTYNLYRTSLGVAGTELLKSNLGSISYSPDDQVLAVDDGQVYFMEAMNGNHLWWTPPDGQPVLLKDIPSLMDNPQVEFMQVLNHRLYFAYGNQLWTASGTASEAHILYSLAYPIKFMTTFQGKLLFDQSRPAAPDGIPT